MLPLDKAGKQRIVVAGPMVRVLPGDWLAAVQVGRKTLGTAYTLACVAAHGQKR